MNTSSARDDRYPEEDSRAAAPKALALAGPIVDHRAREHRALTVPTSWNESDATTNRHPPFHNRIPLHFNRTVGLTLTRSQPKLRTVCYYRREGVSSASYRLLETETKGSSASTVYFRRHFFCAFANFVTVCSFRFVFDPRTVGVSRRNNAMYLAAFKNIPALRHDQDCREVRLCHYAAPVNCAGRSIQRRSLRTASAVSVTWNFWALLKISACRVTQKSAKITGKKVVDNGLGK